LHQFKNKIYCIPFNGETYFLNKVFQSFGVQRYDFDIDQVDALAHKIYDADPPAKPYPYSLGKLRKLAFLTFPEPAVYLDADCIVTSKPELFNQVFSLSSAAIGYINSSPDGVYEDVSEAAELRSRSTFLTSGMIAKSDAAIRIEELARFFDERAISKYHKVRRRGGYVDQPLWNFLVDSEFLPAVDLLADARASRVTSVAGELSLLADGSVYVAGSPVLLLHLAGPALKNTARYRFLLDGMLLGGLRQITPHSDKGASEIYNFLFAH
jgi:hypothetical protein